MGSIILTSRRFGANLVYRRPVQPRGTPREMATAWERWPAVLKLLVKITFHHVLGLEAFLSLHHLKFDPLALFQAFEAIPLIAL